MKKLTVADILQLDILKNVTICAGAAGLSHFVTGITTAEDPDLIQWLTGGEILLTSLYGAVTGPLSFKEYIDALKTHQRFVHKDWGAHAGNPGRNHSVRQPVRNSHCTASP